MGNASSRTIPFFNLTTQHLQDSDHDVTEKNKAKLASKTKAIDDVGAVDAKKAQGKPQVNNSVDIIISMVEVEIATYKSKCGTSMSALQEDHLRRALFTLCSTKYNKNSYNSISS